MRTPSLNRSPVSYPAMQRDTKSSRKTGIEKADLATARKAGGWRDSAVVLGLGKVSDLADQLPLDALCAGTALVGVLRSDGRPFRTGLRMLAAGWTATKAKSFVKHRITAQDRVGP
jgi:hypothetical protein